MSEEESNNEFTQEQFTALQEKNAQLESSTASMQSKMDELLGETKRAKAARKDADETARLAEESKARKAGDFEQLFKSSEDKQKNLQSELDGLRDTISNEKRNSEAMRISNSLAEGDNAELLSSFIEKRLKHTDEGIKVLDAAGQLTVSSIEDLKEEFKNNSRFSALLKGNQSSGGGAAGGKSSSATGKVLTRAEFDGLAPLKRMEFMKSGGATID